MKIVEEARKAWAEPDSLKYSISINTECLCDDDSCETADWNCPNDT